jgi:glycerol-3-phosphate acyltransferase PlsY
VILAGLYISAYFLGAIPFAVLLGRIKGIDILKAGSGNPGMTNVWRNLGPGFGIACFALDILKGLLPTVAARCLIHDRIGPFDPQFLWFTVGCAALVGHSCSIFLGFKGGSVKRYSGGFSNGLQPDLPRAIRSVAPGFCRVDRFCRVASPDQLCEACQGDRTQGEMAQDQRSAIGGPMERWRWISKDRS